MLAKLFEKFQEKRQQVGVIGFVAFAIVVVIGAIVFGQFDSSASGLVTTAGGTAAVANLTQNTYNAFNIVSIGPIIYGAVIILGLVGLLYLRSK